MIREMRLSSFKAFNGFRLPLSSGVNLLVGPNNAGKSTAISALRTAGALMQLARRPQKTGHREDGKELYRVVYFNSSQVDLEDENLRFDFRQADTRMEVDIDPGYTLRACWPADSSDDPFFYFVDSSRPNSQPLRAARECPSVAAVPVLTPIEQREPVLSTPYITKNLQMRLASRHFRNQLFWLHGYSSDRYDSEFFEFKAFCERWLPELSLEVPERREGAKGLRGTFVLPRR